MFVQPTMEYGLALCHKKKDKKIPIKCFNKTIFGIKYGVNPDILGIWSDIDHPTLRQKKLAFNFYKRIITLTQDKYNAKRAANSCFHQFKQGNNLILNYKKIGTKKGKCTLWEKAKEEKIFDLIKKYQGAKIFKGKSYEFTKLISQLDKEEERDIIMWTLNKRSAKWKKCIKCGYEAVKNHMEKCILQSKEGYLDDKIKNTKNLLELKAISRKIKEIQKWIH